MKLKLMDRIVAFFLGLIVFAFGLGVLAFSANLWLTSYNAMYALWQHLVVGAIGILLCALGLHGMAMAFRSGREKGFIAQHTEYGDLSISMSAIENMVKKCVDSHSELKVGSTRIRHARDSIIVSIRISLANGVNIPLAVSALQRQIKQYITSCSGVDVKEVRVMVETNNSLVSAPCPLPADTMIADADAASKAGDVVNSLHETAQNAMPKEMPPKPPAYKKPFHQRLFRREEKPQIVPQPPVSEATTDPSENAAETKYDAAQTKPYAETEPSAQAQPETRNAGEGADHPNEA